VKTSDVAAGLRALEPRLTVKQADRMTRAVLRVIRSALERGEEVKLTEFGRFSFARGNGQRNGYNFTTGERLRLEPQIQVRFKPAPRVIEALSDKLGPRR
jgi:nucleoid DNA-binding protein